MRRTIAVFNAGSSSLKFSLFAAENLALLFSGIADDLLQKPELTVKDHAGAKAHHASGFATGHAAAIDAVLAWVETQGAALQLIACGHRVVHGGREFAEPVTITAATVEKLKALIPLAPLHQPHNVAVIEALASRHPQLPQIACFDTAFHRTQLEVCAQFPLPPSFAEEGILRYGFHGISYQYIASVLPPEIAQSRVVVAHLGNGASLCALRGGKSIATTMGFTALDGLMMGTRAGSIDPGLVLYLLQHKRMDVRDVERLLYKESGLLGVSGISHDMRALMQSSAPRAAKAVEMFCHRAASQLAGLIPAIGGLDAIVFTAGIGEHNATVRARICKKLDWLGVRLDSAGNAAHAHTISTDKSAVSVHVIPTNEERVIAEAVQHKIST